MIPVGHTELHFAYPPRRIQYRQVWIPAVVAIRRPTHPPMPTTMRHPRVVKCSSADELCAANVLLNLSPQETTSSIPSSSRFFTPAHYDSSLAMGQPTTAPRAPSTNILVPSPYARRWEMCFTKPSIKMGSNYGCKSSPTLSQVSDHSGAESMTGSDGSSSEDDVSFADEEASSTSDVPTCSGKEIADTNAWYRWSTSLSLPEDTDVLSPLHCFMRRYCVDAFTASPDDVSTPRYGKSHGVKVVAGQVGIRCLYCKHRPVGNRPDRAVCYPSSLRNIYHSIETWQRRHSLVCTEIPQWVRRSIIELMESSKSRAGGRRQYWEDSAKKLGMVDTSHGVRFSRTPGDLGVPQQAPPSITNDVVCKPVVNEEERDLVTDYLFHLMDQMQTCKFTEEDRTGGRSKVKDNQVDFPGMQCKHCQGKAGFGRYFPATVSALALANSDRNIYNHIQKCRRCPIQIKSNLVRLSRDQTQTKNRRGLRKMFFQQVWNRMHA